MERKKPVQLSQNGKKLIAGYLKQLDPNSGNQTENFKLMCCTCKQHHHPDTESRFPVTFKNCWDEGGGGNLKKIEIICKRCSDNDRKGN